MLDKISNLIRVVDVVAAFHGVLEMQIRRILDTLTLLPHGIHRIGATVGDHRIASHNGHLFQNHDAHPQLTGNDGRGKSGIP